MLEFQQGQVVLARVGDHAACLAPSVAGFDDDRVGIIDDVQRGVATRRGL